MNLILLVWIFVRLIYQNDTLRVEPFNCCILKKWKARYGVYHDVSAVLEVHGHLNECSFRINDYTEIENEQCDCPWGSYGICAHIGAVIHMISLMTFDAFPYHYQKTTSTLQKYLLDQRRKRKEAELLKRQR